MNAVTGNTEIVRGLAMGWIIGCSVAAIMVFIGFMLDQIEEAEGGDEAPISVRKRLRGAFGKTSYTSSRDPDAHPQIERCELDTELRDRWEFQLSRDHGTLRSWRVTLNSARDVVITHRGKSEWIDVFSCTNKRDERVAEASGPMSHFGWSMNQHRWSYGDGPPGSRELSKVLKEAF